jgi:hypothetical protein
MTNTDGVVYFDGTRLVTTTVGTATNVLTSNGVAMAPTFQALPATSISITGDTGGVLTGNAFIFTGGFTGLTFNGSGTTEALEGILAVANGGTGVDTLTGLVLGNGSSDMTAITPGDYGVLISSSTGVPSWLANGTTGQVLTATTSGIASWEAAASRIVTLDADSGSATGSTVTISGGSTGLTTTASAATMDLTGTLKLANGGTNASLTANNGGIFYSTATAGAILAGTATADQVLLSGSSTTPAWSTATYPATTTINQLLYSSANNVIGGITAGDYGVLISSSSGVPSWLANGTTGQVLTATTSGTPSWESTGSASITIDGDTGSATGSTITFNANTNCGASVKFVASGSTVDLEVTDANSNTCIGLDCGSDNGSYNTIIGAFAGGSATNAQENTGVGYQVLADITANGDSNVAIGYESLRQITTGSGNTCIGGGSGTNYTSSESNNIIIGNDITVTVGESNVLRIGGGTGTGSGNLAAAYICGIAGVNVGSVATIVTEASNQLGTAVLTAGTGISIVPTANTITISSSSSGFSWHDVTGGSATLAAENGYIADSASLTTFTMPTNNSIGDTIKIVGKGSGGWSIVYSALQNIIFGNVTSTTTTGNISSNNANDCLELVCTTASVAAPIFTVVSSIGNISVN